MSGAPDGAAPAAPTPSPATAELQPGATAPADGAASGEANPEAPAGEGASPAQPEQARQPDPNDKRSPQYRFGELTAQRNKAQEEAAYWRGVAEGRVQPGAATPPPQAAAPQPPDPANYPHKEFDPAYIRDAAVFEAERRFEKRRDEERVRDREQAAQQQGYERFRTVYDDIAAKGDDFAPALEVLESRAVSRETKDILVSAEHPGYVAAYYADKPRDLAALTRLPLHQQALIIGRIDAQIGLALRAPASPPAPPITPTPTPPPAIKGNGPVVVPNNGAPPRGDMRAYKAWREREFGGG
jgi:hypothetical protein